jgi:hypothetical protein
VALFEHPKTDAARSTDNKVLLTFFIY